MKVHLALGHGPSLIPSITRLENEVLLFEEEI
jgi:hypothetical protein